MPPAGGTQREQTQALEKLRQAVDSGLLPAWSLKGGGRWPAWGQRLETAAVPETGVRAGDV